LVFRVQGLRSRVRVSSKLRFIQVNFTADEGTGRCSVSLDFRTAETARVKGFMVDGREVALPLRLPLLLLCPACPGAHPTGTRGSPQAPLSLFTLNSSPFSRDLAENTVTVVTPPQPRLRAALAAVATPG
jgi:hypothetical protein